MSARAEEYRRKAEDAERQAEQCRDAAARQIYQAIARQWREMAQQAERQQP